MRNGFALVKCKDCGHEYLLSFSCKRRHFCLS
ncbi:MAG: transposase zinc-binding domain-containing protein [Syntrophales bacterium]